MKKEILQEEVLSQQISPPVIVSLTSEQIVVLEENKNIFKRLGFEITCFGGKEYSISGVPNQLSDLTKGDLFTEMLDYLQEELSGKPEEILTDKIASMACKANCKRKSELITVRNGKSVYRTFNLRKILTIVPMDAQL